MIIGELYDVASRCLVALTRASLVKRDRKQFFFGVFFSLQSLIPIPRPRHSKLKTKKKKNPERKMYHEKKNKYFILQS